MLLYLTSNENIGVFDFLIKEKSIIVKKLSGEFNLKKFVIHDMRNLSHCSFVAIDLKAIKDTEEEILEAIIAFKKMYSCRVIIFAEGITRADSIIDKLINEKIYNIVTADTVAKIKEQILKAVSEEGMDYVDHEPKDISINNPKYIFKHKNIKIAVAGASRRAGTTTAAFNLTNYLNSLGAKVSYTEANNNNHLKEIADYYEFINGKEAFKHKGVEYYPDKKFPDDYNFNVFDIGELNNATSAIFNACDVRIICAASKPYEISDMKRVLDLLPETNSNILISFTPEVTRPNIKRLIESEYNKVFFTEYSPSLFDGEINGMLFKEILQDYIIEI